MEKSVHKSVLVSLGTRAELIKMAPVMNEFVRRKIDYFFLHTGQHAINDLVKALGVKPPDEALDYPERVRGRFGVSTLRAVWWNVKMFLRTRRAIKRVKPKVVVVHGDTMTTAVTAVASKSFLLTRPLLAHVEAGLRSSYLFEPYPEEISRRVTDALADLCFAPTQKAAENLVREGKRKERVFVTGNTNVDVLLENLPRAKTSRLPLPPKPYVFAQMHRQENIRRRDRCKGFVEVLNRVKRPVVFVFLENARRQFNAFGLTAKLRASPNITLYDNLPYHDFLKVFSNADCVFTDGGGQTEEATVLKIPTVLWRRANERIEAEEAGVAVRVGSSVQQALHYINDALGHGPFWHRARKARNPFGDGKAGKRIAEVVGHVLHAD